MESVLLFLSLYGFLNLVAVSWYGETEFFLSIGKVFLIVGLLVYTFIVMVGGNPQHHAFGFTYWKSPESFAELYRTGDTGRFLGFFYCLMQAAFAVAGPEYVSMTAGEAENPRTVLPKAYKSISRRLTMFFMLGSLAVGILVPFDDKVLIAAYSGGKAGATASPVRNTHLLSRLAIGPEREAHHTMTTTDPRAYSTFAQWTDSASPSSHISSTS